MIVQSLKRKRTLRYGSAFLGLFILVTFSASGQSGIRINEPVCAVSRQQMVADKDGIFRAVEQSAEFPGGTVAFYKFLAKHIRYPAKTVDVSGHVFVNLVVEKDGSLSNLKILRGLGYGLDEEAIRVLKLSPKWKPGRQNGKPVRQYYTVPVAFIIADK